MASVDALLSGLAKVYSSWEKMLNLTWTDLVFLLSTSEVALDWQDGQTLIVDNIIVVTVGGVGVDGGVDGGKVDFPIDFISARHFASEKKISNDASSPFKLPV